jgi:hypothetical protein
MFISGTKNTCADSEREKKIEEKKTKNFFCRFFKKKKYFGQRTADH